VISRSKFEIQPILDTIVTTAARLCQAELGIIYRTENNQHQMVAHYGYDDATLDYARRNPLAPGRNTVTGRVLLEGRTVHIPDCLADPEYTWEGQKLLGNRSLLGVPLLRDGATIGAIALSRRVVRPFTEKQIELVTTFADQAVIAIENVRLFEEVQARTQELTESLERQTATSEVLGVISRSTSQLHPVLDSIVATASRLCQAEYAFVFRLDDD